MDEYQSINFDESGSELVKFEMTEDAPKALEMQD